jgi:NAD(P)H-dependent FMN reductase
VTRQYAIVEAPSVLGLRPSGAAGGGPTAGTGRKEVTMADRIPILVVNGSVRPGNYTAKASALVVAELQKDPQVAVEVIDPAQLDLPLPGSRPGAESTRLLKEKVAAAAGIVLATPEYHGSFSSVTKLVIENLGFPSALAGKPVALLGVAAGSIGAIKSLEQLRSVCAHVGALALPLPVSVAMFSRSSRRTVAASIRPWRSSSEALRQTS